MAAVTFSVARYAPERDDAPRLEDFRLAVRPAQTVLEALQEIRGSLDPTLAFRSACRSGICGDCALMVNGIPRLACETLVRDVAVGERLQIEPLHHFRPLRDLVVDCEPFFDSLRAVVPWLVTRPDHDGRMTREAAREVEATNACILCGICDAQWEGHEVRRNAPGPGAMVKAYRLALDSRDALGRARLRLAVELNLLSPENARTLQALCPKVVPFGDEVFPALRPFAVQQE